MAGNRITFKEFQKISEELKVYDNLKFINATLGKELITTTLEGKSKTMTLAEWRLIKANWIINLGGLNNGNKIKAWHFLTNL